MSIETPNLSRILLTSQELAEQLKISRSALYRKRSLGDPLPPAIVIGGSLRWSQESVDRFLQEHTEEDEGA